MGHVTIVGPARITFRVDLLAVSLEAAATWQPQTQGEREALGRYGEAIGGNAADAKVRLACSSVELAFAELFDEDSFRDGSGPGSKKYYKAPIRTRAWLRRLVTLTIEHARQALDGYIVNRPLATWIKDADGNSPPLFAPWPTVTEEAPETGERTEIAWDPEDPAPNPLERLLEREAAGTAGRDLAAARLDEILEGESDEVLTRLGVFMHYHHLHDETEARKLAAEHLEIPVKTIQKTFERVKRRGLARVSPSSYTR